MCCKKRKEKHISYNSSCGAKKRNTCILTNVNQFNIKQGKMVQFLFVFKVKYIFVSKSDFTEE